MDSRQKAWSVAAWTIQVCPICRAQAPRHTEPCLSDDPPTLRPDHVPHRVVSEAWREMTTFP